MADISEKQKWLLVRGVNVRREDRHVLLVLFLFQGEKQSSFCKQETLADEIGADPRTVRRSIRRLNELGIVRSDWKPVRDIPMRTYSIDFKELANHQRQKPVDGRTPVSDRDADGRTPVSATVGHPCPDHQDTSVLQEDPLKIHRRSKSGRTQKKFQKPDVAQVREYATTQGHPGFDAGYFVDYYEGQGWKIGRNSMKDWQATVRNWIRRDQKTPATSTTSVDWWPKVKKAVIDSGRETGVKRIDTACEILRRDGAPESVIDAIWACDRTRLKEITEFNERLARDEFHQQLARTSKEEAA